MKKFNEWLENNSYGMGAYDAEFGSVDVGTKGIPPAQVADNADYAQVVAELQKGEVGSYLRMIQRITGQRVFSPTLAQALKRAIAAAPREMTNFLSVVGNMTVGQQGRASQGMTKIIQ